MRPRLGPEEWPEIQTVNYAVTLEDIRTLFGPVAYTADDRGHYIKIHFRIGLYQGWVV